jgi:hypothetical protein
MPGRQSAKLTGRVLVHGFIVKYGRYMGYSEWIDRINRQPLFHRFTEKNLNVPSFSTREALWSFRYKSMSNGNRLLGIWRASRDTAFSILLVRTGQSIPDFSALIALPVYQKIGIVTIGVVISIGAAIRRKQAMLALNLS